ncbi:glycoside hydrolase domain-containing protein, partial [Chloroflexota bacterium]
MRSINPQLKRAHTFNILLAACLLLVSLGAANLSVVASTALDSDHSIENVSVGQFAAGGIHKFKLMSPVSGWVWIDNRVYWTPDKGENWVDLTPSELVGSRILDVHFREGMDDGWGWILSSVVHTSGGTELRLSIADQPFGSWKTAAVHLFTPDQPGFNPGRAAMFWLDEYSGWISLKFRSSSSVSTGTSFRTIDGGNSWQEFPLPVAGELAFSTSQVGWLAGGAAGDELYRSSDGGRSWTPFSPPALPGSIVRTYLPAFDANGSGILPILLLADGGYQLFFYESQDAGLGWMASGGIPLGIALNPAALLIPLMHPGQVAILDPAGRMFHLDGGQLTSFKSDAQFPLGITDMDMFDPNLGWALSTWQDCTPAAGVPANQDGKGSFNCTETSRLVITVDGGRTWQDLSLPAGMGSSLILETQVIPRLGTNTFAMQSQSNELRITTQGFDSCIPGTVSQMQDWWNNSPYYAWNIYIGGSNRGCNSINQATLTASFISQVSAQGWYFIPTWVGLQASCSTGNFWKMSSNASTAYNQGVNEANQASDVMASLGFSGSIIYFDLEAFNMADTTCVNAARSFVNGWTTQLHNRGNLSGLYAMAYKVDNYYTIANRPDGIWMAGGGTNYSSYNAAATVWGNRYVSDDLWNDTRRIYQYTTGHYETWGSTTMNVDSDAVNGIVAVPGDQNGCPAPTLLNPLDGYISPAQEIDFSWQAATGCSFLDYTLRIKDVANMNEGGQVILEVDTTETTLSRTIGPEWNGQDLFWGVRTNFPYSPDWSVRRFLVGSNPACSITDEQVALFTEINFGGDCVVRDVGDYPDAGALGIANDQVSSVLVGAIVSLQLCRDNSFTGICETFYQDDPDLSDNGIGDNQTSSARVAVIPVSVTLFADPGFSGDSCRQNGVGWRNVCTSLNDQASSIRLLSGWSSRVWSGPNRTGESRCITTDQSSFSGLSYNENGSAGLNDSISSFAAYDQPSCPTLLSVVVQGSGTGTITSVPSGINCGSACIVGFPYNSEVTLTATPAAGSTFTGWSGGLCSGASPCTLRMSESRSVTATFTANAYTLNVIKTGSGKIIDNQGGLDCGLVC